MKSIFTKAAVATMLVATAATASAGSYNFSYAPENAERSLLGFEIADHYDVGMFIPGTGLTDAKAKLTEITIQVPINDNLQNFKMWVSTKMDDPGIAVKFKGNVTNKSVTPVAYDDNATFGTITYTLASPYAITADGVYVGYSFDVKAIDKNNNVTKYPLVVTEPGNEFSLIARTSNNYYNFENISEFALCCTATFEGDFYADAVGVRCNNLYLEKGKSGKINATLINLGINSVSTVDYTYTIGEITGSGTLKAGLEAMTGYEKDINITVEGIDVSGEYPAVLNITKVNGSDNTATAPSGEFKAYVLDKMPKHRPVMEEYTGTWCGWCPRGMAAMNMCKDRIDDFIGIAYHGRDVMALSSDVVPFNNSGYPMCFIDRQGERDPYYGLAMQPGKIREEYKALAAEFTPADVDVKAEWNDDFSAMTITGDVKFALIPDDGYDYRINYVVTEDGMKGEGQEWYQLNNYSGDNNYINDRYLREYVVSDKYIQDMEYNDVAIYSASILGIEGSLPAYADLAADTDYTYSHTVSLSDFLTANGKQSYQDKENMDVIALLIRQEGQYGVIVNAAKTKVPSPSAVNEIQASAEVVGVEYFDLAGRKVNRPEHGVFIVVEKLSDGTTHTFKAIK